MTGREVVTISVRNFNIGDRVMVFKCDSYKRKNLAGTFGVVKDIMDYDGGKFAVELDGVRNTLSSKGYHYFKPHELVIINDFKSHVKENDTMPNITNYFNAVKIQFIGDTMPCKYIYANFDSYLKVGHLCVVKPAHHGIALAKVVEILDGNDYETPREIVSIVDTSFYDERVKAREKLAELKSQMEKRAKQLQDIALYEMLAKDDPAMMDLLNQYRSLPNF